MLPVSEACLRNQQPIAEVLGRYLDAPARVLEIGSGTGQHGAYIAARLPHLFWQPTDLAEALPGIRAWREEAGLDNLGEPVVLDVNQQPWPVAGGFDAIFTANTIHFVGWQIVTNLLEGVSDNLVTGGQFLVYGPFNDNGRYTSDGNRQLDIWLKGRDPDSGIKDRQAVIELAAGFGLVHRHSESMPANNEMLVFQKGG